MVVNIIWLVACNPYRAYVVTVVVLIVMENRSSHRCSKDRNSRRYHKHRCDVRLSKESRSAVVLVFDMIDDDQDRNVDCSCPCSRPGSTDKDGRPAVFLVVDMIDDDQDRKVNCSCPCSRPGSTDKDRRPAFFLVVDIVDDDQDRKVNCSCLCSLSKSTDQDRNVDYSYPGG